MFISSSNVGQLILTRIQIEVDQYMPGPGDGINPEYVTDAEIEPVEEQPTRARRVSKVKGPRPLPGSGPYVGPLRQQDVGRVAEELTQFLSGHLQVMIYPISCNNLC